MEQSDRHFASWGEWSISQQARDRHERGSSNASGGVALCVQMPVRARAFQVYFLVFQVQVSFAFGSQ